MTTVLPRSRSTLHLQMGQETLYLLLTSAIFTTILLVAYIATEKRHFDDPPIVTLKEADGFTFTPGSAAISDAFEARLRDAVAPKLKEISERYGTSTIEVVGDTDEVPLHSGARRSDNLDSALLPLLAGRDAPEPIAGDNIGLGMARAVAVSRALRTAGIGDRFTIVPLSAGPFLKPDDTVTDGLQFAADQSRRRIEIRMRRARPR